jgi:hypothetical protein
MVEEGGPGRGCGWKEKRQARSHEAWIGKMCLSGRRDQAGGELQSREEMHEKGQVVLVL